MTSEKFLLKWIWPYVSKKLDRDQFGGMSDNSVAHYLIEVANAILYNLDLQTPLTCIMTMIDFSKGFNRIDHVVLVKEMFDLGVPGWILRILVSYLKDRKLIIRFKDGLSEAAELPGGVGQGTLMGMWFFLFQINFFSSGQEGDTNIAEKITIKTNR